MRHSNPSLAMLAAAGISLLLVTRLAMAQTDKPITVGLDGTFAPHAMPKVGGKPGEVEGFNVDLATEVAKRLKRPINIVAQEFSGLIPALNAGRFDWLAAPTTVTPERAKNLLFTEGYLNTYYQLVLKKSAPDIAGLDALKGKKITVNKGSAYDKWADTNKDRYGFEVLAFPTQTDAVQAVMAGRADANLGGNTVVAWAAKQNPTLKLGARIDEGLMWAAPFRKDDVAGRNLVENAIECMKLDGTIARLHEKWFGIKPEPGSAAVTVFKGYGVPGTDGYDPTEHKPQCG
ncbi:transporter substrate-binding domain-containing protein [Vineibacter terrae]|uniref:Transporter substrate-binding domain-containing protein n=1 Tax=Vineibacter terrae TaxID=2586908 RepID=A0A5C8PUL7_9HYPH|nr:transporter substrate-binding domain-containing protein [Vineibacter terrae]TXL81599.1 transporter substrate-binding domain-containing protein [Vineibacter terrae]